MSLHEPIKPYHFPNIQKVLPAVYDDSLSYYEVLCKVLEQLNQVTDGYNSLYDAMTVLEEAWNEFKNGGYLDTFDEFISKWIDENADSFVTKLVDVGFPEFEEHVNTEISEIREFVETETMPFPLPPNSKYGDVGQVLTSIGGGYTQWNDPVVVTSAIAEPLIEEWLDEHPEATTTVQNRSVTNAKVALDTLKDEVLARKDGIKQRLQNLIDDFYIGLAPASSMNPNGGYNREGGVVSSTKRVRFKVAYIPTVDYLQSDEEEFSVNYIDRNETTESRPWSYYDPDSDTPSSTIKYYHEIDLNLVRERTDHPEDIRINVRKRVDNVDQDITPSDVNIKAYRFVTQRLADIESQIEEYSTSDIIEVNLGSLLTFGAMGAPDLIPVDNTIRMYTYNPIPADIITIIPAQGFVMNIIGVTKQGETLQFISGWTTNEVNLVALKKAKGIEDGYLFVNIKKGDNENFEYSDMFSCLTGKIKASSYSRYNGLMMASLGDSITYGFIPRNYYGYSGQLNSFVAIASNRLGLRLDNKGISGSTVAVVSGRNPMCQRFSLLDSSASIVTFMGGTNDIRNNVQLGTFLSTDNTTFYGALNTIFSGLYDKYYSSKAASASPSTRIIACTPPKLMRTSGGTSGGTGPLYDMSGFCEAIIRTAEFYGFETLDFQNDCMLNPALFQTVHGTESGYTDYYNALMTDGTHPTQVGASIMAEMLISKIERQ